MNKRSLKYVRCFSKGAPNPLNLSVHLAIFVVAIAALYVGAGIFGPLALTVLLTFVLSPIVRTLHLWGFPQLAAVIVSVAVAALRIALVAASLFGATGTD